MRKVFTLLIFVVMSLSLFSQETVQLRWNPSTDNVGVEGYNVWLDAEYYGTTSDTFFILSLDPGIYALAVSAFDAAGNESDKSEVLMLTIEDKTSPTIPDSLMIVYPNPTYGNFTLRFNQDLKDNSHIQILKPNGQLVYERVIPVANAPYEEQFNLINELKPGLYVVALIENNERKGHTFLIVGSRPRNWQV